MSARPRTMTAEREAEIRKVSEYCSFDANCELLAELDAERAVSKALTDALENVEFVLRKHAESAVLIRDGDITKATIKPHCAIRKGSAAHEFARAALAQYAVSFPEKEINLEPR